MLKTMANVHAQSAAPTRIGPGAMSWRGLHAPRGSISFRTRVNGLEGLACLTPRARPPPHGAGRKTFYNGNQVK
jgi:hypothetical protein